MFVKQDGGGAVNGADDAADFCWGARAIGRAIGLSERQARHLLESCQLKCARKLGPKKWVARRTLLIAEIGGGA